METGGTDMDRDRLLGGHLQFTPLTVPVNTSHIIICFSDTEAKIFPVKIHIP
jgi:hypothetical protein